MTDFPGSPPTPLFVPSWSRFGMAFEKGSHLDSAGIPSSMACPAAGFASYMPMWLPWPYLVARVFWINGSSVTSVNMDFGIYTAVDGTRIYSTGSTAEVGASAVQYVTPTAFLLAPGRYYFALACDSSTANRGGYGSTLGAAAQAALCGQLQETVFPLPATMTPVTMANPWYPICGVTRTASGF